MIVYPAIDLVAGRVVRLRQGVRSAMDVYSADPVAQAESFAAAGAEWVHMVDLSRAFGEDDEACEANRAAIRAVCATVSVKVDAGGGVRSLDDVDRLLDAGVARVSIGTPLVRDPDSLPRPPGASTAPWLPTWPPKRAGCAWTAGATRCLCLWTSCSQTSWPWAFRTSCSPTCRATACRPA